MGRRYPAEVADVVARSLHRVSNSLLHTPSIRAHELARSGELEDYRKAMSTLFGIDVELPADEKAYIGRADDEGIAAIGQMALDPVMAGSAGNRQDLRSERMEPVSW